MENTAELTLGEKREALLNALTKMDEKQQEQINITVNNLVKRLKLKNPSIHISYESGIEIVACLGQFMIRSN